MGHRWFGTLFPINEKWCIIKLGEKMKQYIPTYYYQNIHTIPYDKLKSKGIRCLVFDLDNTLSIIEKSMCEEKTVRLIQALKKDFLIVIISNNTKKRVQPYQEQLGVEVFSWAMKPSCRVLKKISKKYAFSSFEMVMIGDQIMTDVKAGNRFGAMTILVDPLGKKDLKVTSINRFFEKILLTYFRKIHVLERGKYDE